MLACARRRAVGPCYRNLRGRRALNAASVMTVSMPMPKTARSSCLAVVPAYNEEATVGRVIEQLAHDEPDLDVLVIDDGSTDRTAEEAEAAGAKVLRLPFNLGIGGAVQAGFAYALEHGYQYMVQVDGDGQHDPSEIGKLFDAMEAGCADMICGSRFAGTTCCAGCCASPSPTRRPASVSTTAARSRCSRATTRTTTPRWRPS
jgi:glycosyltransferase involved in cell wall biosynthesis